MVGWGGGVSVNCLLGWLVVLCLFRRIKIVFVGGKKGKFCSFFNFKFFLCGEFCYGEFLVW